MVFCEETPCLKWKSVDAGQRKRLERGKGKRGDLQKQIEGRSFLSKGEGWQPVVRRLLKKRGEGEEIALGCDRFGASLTIWQCTYSPSPLEKQTNLNVVTHTNISYQSWYWIGCNDYLVVVFASLKLTDDLINLIWIFKWFTTNQSVFLGVSFSEYYIDVKFHTDWRCSSNYREFGGKNQFHNYPNIVRGGG